MARCSIWRADCGAAIGVKRIRRGQRQHKMRRTACATAKDTAEANAFR
ncbi:hypothetical protein X739_31465 [Mesorhizobium sp. LNHC220B00]|nr:hypothetical protein X739_31465 [Mesorhizobium sp. LNHC220B00]ESY88222.1 hypothetical protein X741_31630 [Mesorhizobium sp. LNHC229A00]